MTDNGLPLKTQSLFPCVCEYVLIITDRHPNPLFSVCIISPNAERKIMQTKCVRKTGAVFFGAREIIRGNLTRAKSARSIIKTRR